MVAPKRKIAAVVTLLFVAPLVAEYLLGDLPLSLLSALVVLAPSYGGGAVLIREATRRSGRGWPTMLVLGAAYTVLAEGLVTQSLFNPDYLKLHMHFLAHAYIPMLGIGGWWTLFMFNLHTFWSMGASIALAEALFPGEAERPWLGWVGDAVVAVVFALGLAASFGIGFKQNHFLATPAQLWGSAAVSVLLVAGAFLLPAGKAGRVEGPVPGPWATGAAALLLGLGVLLTPPMLGWGAVGLFLAIDVVFLVLLGVLSRRAGWGALQKLSVAAGGAVAYGLHAFTAAPLMGGVLWMRISNAVFLLAAVGLIGLAARRVLGFQRQA